MPEANPPIRTPQPGPVHSRQRTGRGFTLIELVVVMSVIALLLTLAVPRYFHALDNARINVQRQNAAAIREAIDKFFGDQGRYPGTLSELVEKRYLRALPVDPISESNEWIVIAPLDSAQGAVYDVRPPAPLVATAGQGG